MRQSAVDLDNLGLSSKEREFIDVWLRLGGTGWWSTAALDGIVPGNVREVLMRLVHRGLVAETTERRRKLWRLVDRACPTCADLTRHVHNQIVGKHTDGAYTEALLAVGDTLHMMTVGGEAEGCPLRVVARLKVLAIKPTAKRYFTEDEGWKVGYPVEAVWEATDEVLTPKVGRKA